MTSGAQAHIAPMLKREPVEAPERQSAPVPDPLLARPTQGEPDWEAILERIEQDFPKTLARLAE